MTEEFQGYSFNVQIWEECGQFNYAVVQEFDGEEDTVIGFGTAGSFFEAAKCAAEEVHAVFNV